MSSATDALADQWVAVLLGLSVANVWRPGVRVVRHAGLGDYPGIWVLRRADAIRVSVPKDTDDAAIDDLAARAPDELIDTAFWRSFAPTRGFVVLGPSVHAFTDEPVAAAPDVEQVDPSAHAGLRDAVDEAEWSESGFAADVPLAFALRSGGDIAAASNLTPFRGVPTDVGVLTHPAHRGRGHRTIVARAATAYAVHRFGLARYRALATNQPSRAIAAALDYEDRFDQLAIRPAH
jgi:hypothetical protein